MKVLTENIFIRILNKNVFHWDSHPKFPSPFLYDFLTDDPNEDILTENLYGKYLPEDPYGKI